MAFAAGTRLGPYEILAPIGAGGMGEIYCARDPRVGRDVAIKVSSEQFTDRFTREIYDVAALNHSNVCTLCDVSVNCLVMELIDDKIAHETRVYDFTGILVQLGVLTAKPAS